MKWTLGLLLLAFAGCGYRQDTKMVACPETGCPKNVASSSPQGLGYTPVEQTAVEPAVQGPPITPLPDDAPPLPTPPPSAP